MRILNDPSIKVLHFFAAFAAVIFCPQSVWGDSLSLTTNLEYRMSSNDTTSKITGETRKTDNEEFWQIYNLDAQKELWPNLTLNAGGVFDDKSVDTESNGDSSDRRENAIRPYVELQLSSPNLDASTGYRKNDLKLSGSERETTRRFTEDYNGSLGWRPVELPAVDLLISRSLRYNEPNATERKIDNESETYQLITNYDYQNYRFDYSHSASKDNNKITGFETTSDSDIGTVRYNDTFQKGRFTLNGTARIKRDQVNFSGSGDRLVPTSSPGSSFYSLDDPPPATSTNINDFVTDQSLGDVNLLQDGANQLSFGLDYRLEQEVDTIYVSLVGESPLNNQASPNEVDSMKHLYSWQVMVSDDQINWTFRAITQNDFDVFENRFEISFISTTTVFVKLVVTPLPTVLVPGKEIRVSSLNSFRLLPPDVNKFTTTDWKTNLNLTWKISDKTTSSYDLLYREERSEPYDDKRSLLSTSVRLNHILSQMFAGNVSLTRTAVTERGRPDRVAHTFTSSLGANYLDTFSQRLTYSFTHNDDGENGTGTTNALLMRNNLNLYEGWSMTFDAGYSWQSPADSEDSNRTFVRIDNSVTPNRWMHFTVFYQVEWVNSDDKPQQQEETGRLLASWVPTNAVSLNADIITNTSRGDENESSTVQQYFINWSPLRNGTLQLALSYATFEDDDGFESETLSPSASWQINRKTRLTCDYAVGERSSNTESTDFNSARATLRILY